MWFLPSRSHAAGAPCALGVGGREPTRRALSVARSRIVETGVHCKSEGQRGPSNFTFYFLTGS